MAQREIDGGGGAIHAVVPLKISGAGGEKERQALIAEMARIIAGADGERQAAGGRVDAVGVEVAAETGRNIKGVGAGGERSAHRGSTAAAVPE